MDYYIKSTEWKEILSILRKRKDIRTGNETKLRIFIEAIWYIAKTGCQWRLLPRYYGSWRAIHMRFQAWTKKNIWNDTLSYFHKDSDMQEVMIDATIVRAHACSSGYKKDSNEELALGRSKGGFSTKIHAMVDALGNPLKFILSAGQRNDITQAENLINEISNTKLIADKGYDANSLVISLEGKSCDIVIPSKKNRKTLRPYDYHIYKERHLIECFFGKIKHFRRIFSRFDKMPQTFLAFINFVSILIWLR
jgi:transposase